MNCKTPLAALLVVGACASPPPPPPPAPPAPPPEPEAPVLASGVDKANFDTNVRAQDDFFRHVNGMWLDKTVIPEDRSNYGTFTVLADASEKNLKAIIDEVAGGKHEAGSEAQKIADFFNAFMDAEKAESLGVEPLAAELALIGKIKTKSDVARHFGHMLHIGAKSPVAFWVDQDAKESTRYIGYLHQSGLGMPDRDYYVNKDAKFKGYRKAYQAYIAQLLQLAGRKRSKSAAKKLMKLETKLAKKHWTRVQNRNRDKTYNKLTFAELQKAAPKFDWKAFFEGAKIPQPEAIIVRQPDYVASLNDRIKKTRVATWKRYFEWTLINNAAPLLNSAIVDAQFAFYSKTLRGIEQNRPRWKRAVSALDGALGEALGKIYVERHFKPEAKARMKLLVENLTKAFDQGIDGLEWMTDETKPQAKTKLSKFVSKIGYPDKWKDYSGLTVAKDTLVANVMHSRMFQHEREVKKLGGPIDRGEWFMNPQTVNAYYNPSMNEIVFPAAILQPPFFNMEADDAVNYGAIGAVIGHELSHGFDDQGRKSDGDGNLRDWWTEADKKEFTARAQRMVEQYGEFAPIDGANVNGALTLGENIGDLGGLTIAYKAYKLSLGDKAAPVIDGYTGDQRFFVGWAQVWRRKYREAELRRRLVTDPHSPSRYRVIGVLANMPEFYEAFGLRKGDKMYREPELRVKIW